MRQSWVEEEKVSEGWAAGEVGGRRGEVILRNLRIRSYEQNLSPLTVEGGGQLIHDLVGQQAQFVVFAVADGFHQFQENLDGGSRISNEVKRG